MLTLICGFPRAGKTTYSQQYEGKCPVLHFDEIHSYSYILKQVQNTTDDIVIEGIYIHPRFREQLVKAYHGQGTQCIYLNTSIEIRKTREGYTPTAYHRFDEPTYFEG